MSALEMRQILESTSIPTVLQKFVAREFAGCQEQVDTLPVRLHPTVRVSLCRQRDALPHSRIAARWQGAPERPPFAGFAGLPIRHHVVGGTEQLEVIQVINDGNSL